MRWEDEEISYRANFSQSRVIPSLLSELCFFIYSVYIAGILSVPACSFVLTAVFTAASIGYISRAQTLEEKKWCVFIYFETTQTMVMLAAVYVQPGLSSLFCIGSTIVLAVSEVSPIYPAWLNVTLACKHLAIWTYLLSSNYNFTFFPFGILPIAWSIFHIMLCVTKKKEVLLTIWRFIEALHREERRLEALLQAIPDGVVVLNESQEVVTCNSAFEQQMGMLSGSSREEQNRMISGLKYAKNLESRSSLIDDIHELTKGESGKVMNFAPVLHNDCYLEWRGVVTHWGENKVCILTVRDTSRWVELEQKANSENERKTTMLRSVSHELRTPTNAILNLTLDLQTTEQLSPQGFADTSIIISAASFLLSLINDLLDFSRIIHDKFSLLEKNFNLDAMLRQCLHLMEPQCKAKRIDLKYRQDPGLPQLIFSDENRMRQIVLNLLSNALKFTVKGSITLIALEPEPGKVCVSVEDTGIGISEDDQSRIFSLFGKLEGNQKLNPQGCGLGLGISSLLVEKLGGKGICLTSEVGRGSVFSFTVPVSLASEEILDPPTEAETEQFELEPEIGEECILLSLPCVESWTGSSRSSSRCPDVLIVDDSSFNRIVARKLVEARGYLCAEASTGREALDVLHIFTARGQMCSVIMMDSEMPEMDGAQATKAIREMERRGELPRTPIIIGCSANSSLEDKARAMQAGMDYFIEKPIVREELYLLLARHAT